MESGFALNDLQQDVAGSPPNALTPKTPAISLRGKGSPNSTGKPTATARDSRNRNYRLKQMEFDPGLSDIFFERYTPQIPINRRSNSLPKDGVSPRDVAVGIALQDLFMNHQASIRGGGPNSRQSLGNGPDTQEGGRHFPADRLTHPARVSSLRGNATPYNPPTAQRGRSRYVSPREGSGFQSQGRGVFPFPQALPPHQHSTTETTPGNLSDYRPSPPPRFPHFGNQTHMQEDFSERRWHPSPQRPQNFDNHSAMVEPISDNVPGPRFPPPPPQALSLPYEDPDQAWSLPHPNFAYPQGPSPSEPQPPTSRDTLMPHTRPGDIEEHRSLVTQPPDPGDVEEPCFKPPYPNSSSQPEHLPFGYRDQHRNQPYPTLGHPQSTLIRRPSLGSGSMPDFQALRHDNDFLNSHQNNGPNQMAYGYSQVDSNSEYAHNDIYNNYADPTPNIPASNVESQQQAYPFGNGTNGFNQSSNLPPMTYHSQIVGDRFLTPLLRLPYLGLDSFRPAFFNRRFLHCPLPNVT